MMRRAMAVVALVAAIAAANAPADRYFGRMKMSGLRIRYETMQLRKRYESHELYPDQAEHLVDLTADAFRAWAAAYPHDSWLPSTGFMLAQLYAELPGGAARTHAVTLFTYVRSHFPTTRYAAQSRALLHRGIPRRPEPPWAIVTPSPSPAPVASASPMPSASPIASAAPIASASPKASASP